MSQTHAPGGLRRSAPSPAAKPPAQPPARGSKLFYWVLIVLAFLVFGYAVYSEFQASRLQARYFSGLARDMKFVVEPGASASIRFPQHGPYDQRLGYSEMPGFIKRLTAKGYEIDAQARVTHKLAHLIESGYAPPYGEKTQAGLAVLDCRGEPLFNFSYPERAYKDFESIPGPVVHSLLFIENRELLDATYPTRNPAIEWTRFGRAIGAQFMKIVDRDYDAPGGSTLATQIEKYRHSPGGITASAMEKLRQMYSATLRAYSAGPDTSGARRRIVLEYLNTVPFAAAPEYGEVTGIGDGLWAWFGADFRRVNALLSKPAVAGSSELAEQGRAYRQVLSLLISQRRPTWFLGPGREQLNGLTESYIRLAALNNVITPELRDAALDSKLTFRTEGTQPRAFVRSWKGATAIRNRLAATLDTPRLYDVDRLDVQVASTLDAEMQDAVTDVLKRLGDRAYVKSANLAGERLLGAADPGSVLYTFTLYERGKDANFVRIQTDNSSQPFDTNEQAKLELGSTAKLRTLATYLEIVSNLHEQLSEKPAKELRAMEVDPRDHMTRWAIEYLASGRDKSLEAMLDAALERRYSASPGETFFTGAGAHTFSNFKREDDFKQPSVKEALRESINLAFIRIMRDVAYHFIYRGPDSSGKVLQDPRHPERAVYLSRFADHEGRVFMRHFYRKYQGLARDDILPEFLDNVRPAPHRYAVIYRTVVPEGNLQQFAQFMRAQMPGSTLTDGDLAALYEKYGIDKFSLQDRGYLARVHPLELWLVAYMRQNPDAKFDKIVEASRDERQAVYQWLFKSKAKAAQNTRIRTLLEMEAFTEIHKHWKRLGYPFNSLVPSYATAIGVSGDRPAALAELMGIILNNGVRLPTSRIEELHFAADTPYETIVRRGGVKPEQVMKPEVAAALKKAVTDVVENGTARRVKGAFKLSDKTELTVGGKTGTGDNRVEVFGAGGHLIKSKAVSRTATFAFFIGDRWFGVITAYVPGATAQNYNFTSALPVQILKNLAPELNPYLDPATARGCGMNPSAARLGEKNRKQAANIPPPQPAPTVGASAASN
ncbi:MAG TPA: transglycosylase domain-containing protein [Burkholderiales bacterium]|nr:transglycosylase domain-containing protein [Burkholderiales bacterium]